MLKNWISWVSRFNLAKVKIKAIQDTTFGGYSLEVLEFAKQKQQNPT